MKYFIIIDQDEEEFAENAVAVDWNKLPDELLDNLPGYYLKDVWAVDKEGHLFEKTVVYIDPIEEDDWRDLCYEGDIPYWKIGDVVIVEGLYDL